MKLFRGEKKDISGWQASHAQISIGIQLSITKPIARLQRQNLINMPAQSTKLRAIFTQILKWNNPTEMSFDWYKSTDTVRPQPIVCVHPCFDVYLYHPVITKNMPNYTSRTYTLSFISIHWLKLGSLKFFHYHLNNAYSFFQNIRHPNTMKLP